MEIYARVSGQWVFAGGGMGPDRPVALRTEAVESAMRIMGVGGGGSHPRYLDQVQILASFEIDKVNKKLKKQSDSLNETNRRGHSHPNRGRS